MISKKDLTGVKDFIYYRDVKDGIYEHLLGQRELIKAEPTHWGGYDDVFKWLRTEISGFAGIGNMGKSKFLIFLTALKMHYANWKVAIYSPETTPSEFFFANFLHTLTGAPVFGGDRKPSLRDAKRFEKLLEDNLFLCEPEKMPTFRGIMERFQKAYEYHGCDMFIIDPFNCLDREWELSKRDDRYVAEFLDHFKHFVSKTNTCGVVVIHPNSSIKTKIKSVEYETPTMFNLAGGAMWSNKLDNLIFVHRPNFVGDFKDPLVLLRHAKIKKREIVGRGGDAQVYFNFRTNRFDYSGYEPMFEDVMHVQTDLPFDKQDNDLPF